MKPLSLPRAQAKYEGPQSFFLWYTNINNKKVQLHQILKDLGLAEDQPWQLPGQKKALHSLPPRSGVVAQPCCGSPHTGCKPMWPGNCKGVPVEKSHSLLAGKQGGSCHYEANTKICMVSEGLFFDCFPAEDDKLVWSLCSKRNSF